MEPVCQLIVTSCENDDSVQVMMDSVQVMMEQVVSMQVMMQPVSIDCQM